MAKSGTTATFKYNSEGLRVQKTVNGTVTNYTLHGKNIVHMTQGSNTLHFWYDASNRPAIVQFNGTKYAYIHNLQGDIVGILNTSGTEVVKYTYDAWGKVLSTGGSLASTLGAIQPFRYRGYVYDVETGLYYLRTRYYNPQWERFINADALINGNLFAYCSNNPIIYKDSNGTSSILVAYEIEKFITALFVILDGYLLGKGIEKIYESNLLSSPSSINQKDINYQHVDGLLYSSGVMDGIGYAVQRARTQESAKRSNGFQIHHIVPWKDNRCENARNVLEKAGINPKKDERNQITIPTQLHKFLNTDAYDISIDLLFTGIDQYTLAQSSKGENTGYQDMLTYNVCLALDIIRSALEIATLSIWR